MPSPHPVGRWAGSVLNRHILIVDEMQRLIETKPRARELVSSYVGRIIANISIICECLRQLDIYFPWAMAFDSHMVERQEQIKRTTCIRRNFKNIIEIAKYANPSNRRFAYPFEKRRNKNNVEKLRQAKSNLDDFWAKLDRHMRKPGGISSDYVVRSLLAEPRSLQRTPEWIEPSVEKKHDADVDTNLAKPLGTFYIGRREFDSSGLTSRDAKPKIKTRALRTQAQLRKESKQKSKISKSIPNLSSK